ncbi:MAG: fibronectin type III domain-containing protein, partial [Spirochaetaceae bacterium]|nr:fibronectin type III domain-containing protein [Spirochaetaceae bacterium]
MTQEPRSPTKTRGVFVILPFCIALVFAFASCEDPAGTGGKLPGDTTPPASVTGLSADSGIGQVTLSWTDPADADLDSIEISWAPAGGALTQPVTVAKSAAANRANNKTITRLTSGTEYTFTVKAVDTAGNKNQGETVRAKAEDVGEGTVIPVATTDD